MILTLLRLKMNGQNTDCNNPIKTSFIVYRKRDIVVEPMNSRDVLPKNVPGVGWGGSCRDGVGWVI